MNKVAMNVLVEDFLLGIHLITGIRIAGSQSRYMFNFIRNCHFIFQSGCTILFLLAICESSDCSTSLLKFGGVYFLKF